MLVVSKLRQDIENRLIRLGVKGGGSDWSRWCLWLDVGHYSCSTATTRMQLGRVSVQVR